MMRTLRQLILEEKCPYCGDPKAYVGMRDVECPNKKCKGFSQRQYDDVMPSPIVSIETTNRPWANAKQLATVLDPTRFDVDALETALKADAGMADGFLLCIGPNQFVNLETGKPDERPSVFDDMPGNTDVPATDVDVGVIGWWVNDSALDYEGIAHALENGRSFKI